ncbi:MAG: GAF domain-containing protein [Pseudomonadota bacterium]
MINQDKKLKQVTPPQKETLHSDPEQAGVALRKKAEDAFRMKGVSSPEKLEGMSTEEIRLKLHELQVHQIELEMQNDELRRTQAELDVERVRYFALYDLAPVGYCTLSEAGLIIEANLTFAALLGVTRGALVKRPISSYIFEEDQEIYYLLRKQFFAGYPLVCELRMVGKSGAPFWVRLDANATQSENDAPPVCRIVLTNITERKQAEELLQTRMNLVEYATDHTQEELLRKTLDEVGRIVDSPIGFYHFVEPDQKTLSLQTWSTSTLEQFCKAEGKGLHYSLDKAGVWVECVQQRKPVIHNDYASLPNRKGLPEGHAAVTRELVVPILRDEHIVAILGVGNKPQDYTKQDVSRVNYLADVAWHIIEGMRNEQSLIDSVTQFHRLSEEYHALLDNLPDGVARIAPDYRIIWTNRSMQKMMKTDNAHLQDICCYSAFWNFRKVCNLCPVTKCFHTGEFEAGNLTTPDGRLLELRAVPIFDESGKVESVIEVIRDISENRKLEDKLIQAQKMESVGRLAGGVAHDYNNMLSVILGYSELALEKLNPTDSLYEDLQEIHNAAVRSTDITRQLLAFARKQTIAPVSLDLNEMVEGMLKMLRRLIGEDIDLAWLPKAGLWPVKIDPSQVDQLLANFCINARDAIDGVGRVSIETDMTTFDEAYCADHPGFVPGEYVLLAVSDDGCGMDSDTVDKIFEPFFTTKEVGQGTGLGLATVYGIVKQNGGFINVYSEPGKGSTFKIYLARHADPVLKASRESPADIPSGHGEVVLVVEDEVSILTLAKRILEELGYTVLPAQTPSKALRLVEENQSQIDLLITDVVMPEMNGKDLSNRLHTLYPGLKTLFMSGYTADVIAHRGVLDEGINFMQKPFSKEIMAVKVREALDGWQSTSGFIKENL